MALKVLVTYTLKPGHRDAFLADVSPLRPLIQAEEGCVQYDYFASVADENQALLVEQWDSRDAQKVHLTQPHMAGIRQAKEDHVLDTDVQLIDM